MAGPYRTSERATKLQDNIFICIILTNWSLGVKINENWGIVMRYMTSRQAMSLHMLRERNHHHDFDWAGETCMAMTEIASSILGSVMHVFVVLAYIIIMPVPVSLCVS